MHISQCLNNQFNNESYGNYDMMNERKNLYMYIIVAIIGFGLIRFIIDSRTPVKYAVRIEEIQEYSGAILVRQTWHTGTGWEIVGDTNGFYENRGNVLDVKLEGDLPPTVGAGGEHVNVFLCKVELTGKYQIPGTISPNHIYDVFEVFEWYPIYPVKREEVFLPAWVYPDNYYSKYDMK